MSKSNEKEQPNSGYRETIFQITEKYLNEYYDIRYNEVSNETQYKLKDQTNYKDLNYDTLYVNLQNQRINISQPKLLALLRSGIMENHNPFRHYFERVAKLPDANKEDHITKLASYVKAQNQERFNHHFKKMLVRSIACCLDEKVVNKQAFILVQRTQDGGKTTFLTWLCPEELSPYITQNIGADKDSLIALSENFLINLDELAGKAKLELNALKSMFSTSHIKIRRPFEKKAVVTPRRANFVGSTNKTDFLVDETGSVRWLCFEIESINFSYKEENNLDLIWGQAYNLYLDKFPYQLTREEIAENEKENRKYQQTTQEIDLIQRYYIPATKEDSDAFYTATDFTKHLPEKFGAPLKTHVVNIGKALTFLDFKQDFKYNGMYSVKGYYIKFNSNINNNLTQLHKEDKPLENTDTLTSE